MHSHFYLYIKILLFINIFTFLRNIIDIHLDYNTPFINQNSPYYKWSKIKIFNFWRGIRTALKQKVFSVSSSFNEDLSDVQLTSFYDIAGTSRFYIFAASERKTTWSGRSEEVVCRVEQCCDNGRQWKVNLKFRIGL